MVQFSVENFRWFFINRKTFCLTLVCLFHRITCNYDCILTFHWVLSSFLLPSLIHLLSPITHFPLSNPNNYLDLTLIIKWINPVMNTIYFAYNIMGCKTISKTQSIKSNSWNPMYIMIIWSDLSICRTKRNRFLHHHLLGRKQSNMRDSKKFSLNFNHFQK